MPLAEDPPDFGEPAPMYREAPANIDVEMALLGAILVKGAVLDDVRDLVTPDDFFMPAHRVIYGAILATVDRGGQATPAMLRHHLEYDEQLAIVGGPRYLAELAHAALNTMDADDYARIIADLARKRRLIEIGEALVHDCYEAGYEREAVDVADRAQAELDQVVAGPAGAGGLLTVAQAATTALREAEEAYQAGTPIVGTPTGLASLDEALGGLRRGRLYVLGGATNAGKTALGLQVAHTAATDSRGPDQDSRPVVLYFSLEMTATQLANRLLARESGIASDRIDTGRVGSADWTNLFAARDRLAGLELHIDDATSPSPSEIARRAKRLKRSRKRLDLIVIDYLQKIGADGTRYQSEYEKLSAAAFRLHDLAKTLDVPVVMLSQLSRDVDERDNTRPTLGDLRGSGSIEAAADVVLFCYRESYYLSRKEPQRKERESDLDYDRRRSAWSARLDEVRNRADIIIAKNRHGPRDITCTFEFDGPLGIFREREPAEPMGELL